MQVLTPGHVYELPHLDGNGHQTLHFVMREAEHHEGITTQEVIRVLIDRTQHCDGCLRWTGNDQIIKHLRMALVLHEARAIMRRVEKGELAPELLPVGTDGHFILLLKEDT